MKIYKSNQFNAKNEWYGELKLVMKKIKYTLFL